MQAKLHIWNEAWQGCQMAYHYTWLPDVAQHRRCSFNIYGYVFTIILIIIHFDYFEFYSQCHVCGIFSEWFATIYNMQEGQGLDCFGWISAHNRSRIVWHCLINSCLIFSVEVVNKIRLQKVNKLYLIIVEGNES